MDQECPFCLVLPALTIGLVLWLWYQYQRTGPYLHSSNKAVFITGCDSGIGFVTALLLDKKGFHVFAGCLFPDGEGAQKLKSQASNRLTIIDCDVTNEQKVNEAVDQIKKQLKKEEKLWAIISNAGVCIMGLFEWYTWDQITQIMNVNLLGTIRITKAFLPLLRQSKGRIVIVTSIATRLPIPGGSVYNASKFALQGLAKTLRIEMERFDIRVIQIEPGDYSKHTDIMKQQKLNKERQWQAMSAEAQEFYQDIFAEIHKGSRTPGDKSIPPEVVFKDVLQHMQESVLSEYPQDVYMSMPGAFRIILLIMGHLPEWVQDAFIRKIVKRQWKIDS